jgi:phosphate transport system substrate-binding protein
MTRRTVLLLAACTVMSAVLALPARSSTPASAEARDRAAAIAEVGVGAATSGRSAPAPIRGRGSTYVGPAMGQWKADAQTSGLRVEYTPTGSPDGLQSFIAGTVDFAGTEAEFSSLLAGQSENAVPRGFQYIPDVAGAIAVMYNVSDQAGNRVDQLRLSRETVARIFLGEISNWSDPAITNDNGGRLVLPDKPITVVYRSRPSGTTALFYDFVANMAPGPYRDWVARNRINESIRVIELPPNFVPNPPRGEADSDQMALTVANTPWTISYDEFSYALSNGADVAWIQNESGAWTKPYAGNISAALESASLRPDLSQELSGVYRSGNPAAYPISAYSYMVTQCAPSPQRATCAGRYGEAYGTAGADETLSIWLRYIACEGQIEMANIGYSPLPPNLSQEVANSIARMNGVPESQAEQLTRANCANPRFDPNYSFPVAPDPPPLPDPPVRPGDLAENPNARPSTTTNTQCVTTTVPVQTTSAPAQTTTSDGRAGIETTTSTTAVDPCSSTASTDGGAGRGLVEALGGSDDWRETDPAAYSRPGMSPIGRWTLVVLVALLALPVAFGGLRGRLRRS